MSSTRHQDQPRTTNRRRALAFALVGLGVVGIGAASASQLNVTGGQGDVASGVVGVQVAGTTDVTANLRLGDTIDPASGAFPVSHVALTGLSGSDQSVTVIALDSSGGTVGTGTAQIDADVTATDELDVTLTPVSDTDPITNHSGIVSLAVVVTPTPAA